MTPVLYGADGQPLIMRDEQGVDYDIEPSGAVPEPTVCITDADVLDALDAKLIAPSVCLPAEHSLLVKPEMPAVARATTLPDIEERMAERPRRRVFERLGKPLVDPVQARRAEAARRLRMMRYWCAAQREEMQRVVEDATALRTWASSKRRGRPGDPYASLLQPFAAAVRRLYQAVSEYDAQLRRERAMARLGGGSIVEWSTNPRDIGTFVPWR